MIFEPLVGVSSRFFGAPPIGLGASFGLTSSFGLSPVGSFIGPPSTGLPIGSPCLIGAGTMTPLGAAPQLLQAPQAGAAQPQSSLWNLARMRPNRLGLSHSLHAGAQDAQGAGAGAGAQVVQGAGA